MQERRNPSPHTSALTRIRILEAVIALLTHRGGADVSMAEIAHAAKVSRQAVYLHFADRGDLFVAMVHYADEKRGLANQLERIRKAPTGIAALRELVSVQARSNPDIWPLARAADAVRRTDDAVEKAWQDRLRDRHRGCNSIVSRLVEERSLRPGVDREMATDLVWTITSLRTWEDLVLQRRWSRKQYEEYITDILLRAVTKINNRAE
jgi:AcrR family transcriptional regulator